MNDPRSHEPHPDDAQPGSDRPDRDRTGSIDDPADESAMERADRANGEPDAQEPGA